MKTLILCLLIFAGAATQAAPASAQCEALLVDSHTRVLGRKLQSILRNARAIEDTLADMRRRGEITSTQEAARLRAQLAIGNLFAQQGPVHEAVYEVFKERYKNQSGIRAALQSFQFISDWRDKNVILSEVIERILQYIPDVDTQNVAQIQALASYLNVSPSELEDFRNKWLVYDQQDAFIDLVYGGVMALLIAPPANFIQDVLARGSWSYSLKRKISRLNLPPFPVGSPTVTREQVVTRDIPYYENDKLMSYLKLSSAAARRFFVSDRLPYFTRGQLEEIHDQASRLQLPVQTIADLEQELVFRQEIVELTHQRTNIERRLNQIESTLSRQNKSVTNHSAEFKKHSTHLRAMEDPESVYRRSRELFDDYALKLKSEDYVNMVSSLLKAATTSLLKDQHLSIAFAKHIIDTSNRIALEPTHPQKIRNLLNEFSARVGGNAYIKIHEDSKQLVLEGSDLVSMNEEQLRNEQEQCLVMLREIQEMWEHALSLENRCKGAENLHKTH